MKNTIAIILAAGKGTRMESSIPKVLHPILGKPVINYVLDSLKDAEIDDMVVVVGHSGELLKDVLRGIDIKTVSQKELLGSGDAVNAAKKIVSGYRGDIVVICGDTPLVSAKTIKTILKKHRASKAAATVLTAEIKNPAGYGRIVKGPDGNVSKIVEDQEADFYEQLITEVNVGTYCFRAKDLFDALQEVKAENKKGEYFLTDTIEILHKQKKLIESVVTDDTDEMIGVNTRSDLAEATLILKNRILKKIMASGVTIEDPLSTTIYPGVEIGRDTIIYPNTIIESDVEIGSSCHIGPFARIRGGVHLDDNVEVGNFVELVRARIGESTKVKHHTYLGDALVGKNVNVGAGTITANFDGKKKNRTIIEDGVFLGVGSILIAPVRIGEGATVGAGAVIPKDHNVPARATVIGVPARVIKHGRKR